MKCRRAQDEDRAIDEEGKEQRNRGIHRGKLDRHCFSVFGALEIARLNNARMQVKIMRHHGRTEDTNGDVKGRGVRYNLGRGNQTREHAEPRGVRYRQLVGETATDRKYEHRHQTFDIAETFVLQKQHDQYVGRGDEHADYQRDMEEEIQRNSGADHFGEIARDDGQFAQHPQAQRNRSRIMIATGLGKVPAGDDPQLESEMLEQDRHQV